MYEQGRSCSMRPQQQYSIARAEGLDVEPLTTTIVTAVAEARDVSPLDLPPVASVVDPDALEGLFRGRETNGEVTFTYAGHRVTVTADAGVTSVEVDA